MNIIYKDDEYLMSDGSVWKLEVYDQMVSDLDGQLVNAHSMVRVPTPEEQEEQRLMQERNERIAKLEHDIKYKQLCGLDCSTEQAELKGLLGY